MADRAQRAQRRNRERNIREEREEARRSSTRGRGTRRTPRALRRNPIQEESEEHDDTLTDEVVQLGESAEADDLDYPFAEAAAPNPSALSLPTQAAVVSSMLSLKDVKLATYDGARDITNWLFQFEQIIKGITLNTEQIQAIISGHFEGIALDWYVDWSRSLANRGLDFSLDLFMQEIRELFLQPYQDGVRKLRELRELKFVPGEDIVAFSLRWHTLHTRVHGSSHRKIELMVEEFVATLPTEIAAEVLRARPRDWSEAVSAAVIGEKIAKSLAPTSSLHTPSLLSTQPRTAPATSARPAKLYALGTGPAPEPQRTPLICSACGNRGHVRESCNLTSGGTRPLEEGYLPKHLRENASTANSRRFAGKRKAQRYQPSPRPQKSVKSEPTQPAPTSSTSSSTSSHVSDQGNVRASAP